MKKISSRPHLPLNALRAFETAARHLNFTHAAMELNVTQGAVSRQIKLLEDQINTLLFHRRHRKLSLTDQGQALFLTMNQAFDEIADSLNSLGDQTQELSLKIHPTFAIRWLVPRLHKFQMRYPEIQIRFTTSNMNADLKRENFDIAVTYRGEDIHGVSRIKILDEKLTPVCSPTLQQSAHPLRKPDDLVHHLLLHNSPDQREWKLWAIQTHVSGLLFEKGQVFEIDDAALQAATAGLGVALGDRLLVKEDLISGRLIEPFTYVKINTGAYYLSWLDKNMDKPGLIEFKEWLIKEISLK